MMKKCHACDTHPMDYQLHDCQLGHVLLCRQCFLKLDGRLTLQARTIRNIGLDAVYERHKDSIDRVQAELRKDDEAQLERMWARDGSKIVEGAVRR